MQSFSNFFPINLSYSSEDELENESEAKRKLIYGKRVRAEQHYKKDVE
jgi:hypothetical protein